MIETAIGLIFLFSPFLLLSKLKNKKEGFLIILAFLITFHLLLAVLAQALQIFSYPLILTINGLIFLGVIIKTNFKNLFEEFKKGAKKLDWVLILILIISFISLFSVHYNYSGKYSVVTSPEYLQAENMKYPFPYFSDEWYAVSLIKHSLEQSE